MKDAILESESLMDEKPPHLVLKIKDDGPYMNRTEILEMMSVPSDLKL